MSRQALIERETNETKVSVSLELDGTGQTKIETGIGFFDHMLDHLGRHALCDLRVEASGDLHVDDHHTVEDVGLCLGDALKQALGDKAGIARYGSASAPMDEALAQTAIDLSGRPMLVFRAAFAGDKIGTFDTQLVEEFLRAVVNRAGMTLHVNVPYGGNDHHVAEAIFKAVARALREAKAVDPAAGDRVPSTKGSL